MELITLATVCHVIGYLIQAWVLLIILAYGIPQGRGWITFIFLVVVSSMLIGVA